jgi:hypothetical protein
MYERRQCRAVAKKYKSTIDVDSEKGGTKSPMNICREVKTPPQEQTPDPNDDEVPLKIHSPLEERGSLRESVNYRKQYHSTITCYDVEMEAYNHHFWTFFHVDWYRSMYQSKKKAVVNMQWIDWDFIEKEKNTCLAFAEVIAACEHHGIKVVNKLHDDCVMELNQMGFKYEKNGYKLSKVE